MRCTFVKQNNKAMSTNIAAEQKLFIGKQIVWKYPYFESYFTLSGIIESINGNIITVRYSNSSGPQTTDIDSSLLLEESI